MSIFFKVRTHFKNVYRKKLCYGVFLTRENKKKSNTIAPGQTNNDVTTII